MNVVHFITRLIIGGAQENTLLTVEDQHRDYGDKVTLITGPGLGPEGSLEERARRGGFDFRVLPELHRAIRPWQDWRAYRALIAMLRDIQPQIVHTHSSKAGIIGRAAAAQLGIPAVHTIHGAAFHYGQNSLAYEVYRLAEKWGAKRCDKIISVADAMTEQYVAAGVAPKEKFVTISSGMEVEPFLSPPRPRNEVRRELGLEPGDVVIGKIARLFHLKGHEFVIAAAPSIVRRHPHAKFLFVGDGILRAEYQRYIDSLGLTKNFLFTGLVPPDRVPELIHAMDIVVHTSLWEGLARVLPQGLIAGKPVVSYDVDGAREVILSGETGYLLPPQSIEELSHAINILVADPALRDLFGRTGRERFTDQFRHQTMTRRIREVYAEVLNGGSQEALRAQKSVDR
jgi:glycosyltransferase involved in cell wall biosynthesis